MVFNSQGAAYGSYNDSVVGPQSETERQTFQVQEWLPGERGESRPDGDNDTDDIGIYQPLQPPRPEIPEAFNFPGVGMGSRFGRSGDRGGGGGGMYG
jgi:hypothetical protein